MSAMAKSLYHGLARGYDQARPDYPAVAFSCLAASAGDRIADVGSGTGIFSRQLAQHFPLSQVVGVEPGQDMRRQATAASAALANLSFIPGTAEALPFADDGLALLTAATAAHWFDRPRFYADAFRCLRPGGQIAIVQNRRRWWASLFLEAYEALHERHVDDYRRGTFPSRGGYAAFDALAEVQAHRQAEGAAEKLFLWERPMTRADFVVFSLSSTITQRAIARIGEAAYRAELDGLLSRFASASGGVSILYETMVVTAVKGSVA
jgi:ubiquinone/menaquinone biosynthesis C-methylase UbiE